MSNDILLVSLNNPRNYFYTRHNAGSWWIKYFSIKNKINLIFDSSGQYYFFNNLYLHGKILHILEPNVFMNLNGLIIERYVYKFNIKYNNILLIHDDLDLDCGSIKICYSSGSGGHNGVKSVIKYLNSNSFYRLKIGLGRKNKCIVNDFLLDIPKFNEFNLYIRSIKNSFFYLDYILNFNSINY